MGPLAALGSIAGEAAGALWDAEQAYFSKSKAPVQAELLHGLMHQLRNAPHDHSIRRVVHELMLKHMKVIGFARLPHGSPVYTWQNMGLAYILSLFGFFRLLWLHDLAVAFEAAGVYFGAAGRAHALEEHGHEPAEGKAHGGD